MDRYQFSEEQRTALEGMQAPYAVYQFLNRRVVTLILSDGFCELFQYKDRAQAYFDMDNDMYKDAHPDDVARIANAALTFATQGGEYETVYRSRRGDAYHIIHAKGKHIYTGDGVRLAHVWYTDEGEFTDESVPTERRLSEMLNNALHEESILKASFYDYLTGLPRMTYFFQLAEAGKAAIQEQGGEAALLYFDFSGMKFFNSQHGFAQGDRLIKAFSQLLKQTFSNENCCHVGGDQFAVCTHEEGLEKTLDRLLRQSRRINGGCVLPVRIGIYSNRLEDVPVSTAVDRAKYACDTIRNNYTSQVCYFREEMRDRERLRQYVLTHLDQAMENGWIQVYYQPIVRAVTTLACDEECLARWIDPVKGFLSTADFIPFLEASGLIYKLDLHILEQVLDKINRLRALGYPTVPQSVNLSRSDFDSCDMVEEIRRRVDEAGVSRELIIIEITESVIGSDFAYMKEQVERFRRLGFPVWMDDFGSGYSSLDVLQSIHFDLLKFDMSFMQRLDEGENGKIILTELMKMANALGVDTACEGVETEEQVRFLQEIGCSKLQGYYFQKPVPERVLLERFEKGFKRGYENPEQAPYYESIGRANLYDLTLIANEDKNVFQNVFNSIPMAIVELRGEDARFVRSNQAYRRFWQRMFHEEMPGQMVGSQCMLANGSDGMRAMLSECAHSGERTFTDVEMPDGTVVHVFLRSVATDPVTGKSAVAIAVLSITPSEHGMTYAGIARALARDYYSIYYVDLTTGRFIEYNSPAGGDGMAEEQKGEDFFALFRQKYIRRVYEMDREPLLDRCTRERLTRTLAEHGTHTETFRVIDTGEPVYVNAKITLMPDGKHIIIGISLADAKMKEREQVRERDDLARIIALSDGYLSLYTIDPDTGYYMEYASSEGYDSLGTPREGTDFFGQSQTEAGRVLHPEDVAAFRSGCTRENVLRQLREKGRFTIHYRLMLNGRVTPVSLQIAPLKGRGGQLIAGVRAWKPRKTDL